MSSAAAPAAAAAVLAASGGVHLAQSPDGVLALFCVGVAGGIEANVAPPLAFEWVRSLLVAIPFFAPPGAAFEERFLRGIAARVQDTVVPRHHRLLYVFLLSPASGAAAAAVLSAAFAPPFVFPPRAAAVCIVVHNAHLARLGYPGRSAAVDRFVLSLNTAWLEPADGAAVLPLLAGGLSTVNARELWAAVKRADATLNADADSGTAGSGLSKAFAALSTVALTQELPLLPAQGVIVRAFGAARNFGPPTSVLARARALRIGPPEAEQLCSVFAGLSVFARQSLSHDVFVASCAHAAAAPCGAACFDVYCLHKYARMAGGASYQGDYG
jgi:hypothetical protein